VMDRKVLVVLCLAILVILIVYIEMERDETEIVGVTPPRKKPPSGGSPIIPSPLLNLTVYEDADCLKELTVIDWGVMSPGESKNKTVYIRNTGNADVIVHIRADEWTFKSYNGTVLSSDFARYFNLTWNIEGTTIRQGETVTAVITLSVSPFIHTVADFAFNIHIEYEA